MKNIHFLSALAALLLTSSCALDPPEIPASELYLRSFIKKYGLIDPSQTWNQAVAAEVTLVTDGTVAEGTVYARSGAKYYKVAELTNVSGRITIPIDIVQGVNEIKMVLDGEDYYTNVGGTLNTSDPTSRTFVPEGNAQNGIVDRVTITDAYEVIDVPTTQVFQLFNILPEHGPGGINEYPGNLKRPEIKTDFLLNSGPTGKDITVFPVYWNTCQDHELGIYYFNTSDPSGENANTVVRVPFYKMKKSPQFENVCYTHKQYNGQYYEYEYIGNRTDADAIATSYGAEHYRDNGAQPPVDSYYWTGTSSQTTHENILKYGDAAGEIPNADAFYALRQNVNGGNEVRMASDLGTYCAYEGDHQHYWQVPLTESNKGANSWDNQFRIHLPRPFGPGESFSLKFDCKVSTNTEVGVNNCHDVNGGIQIEASKSTSNGSYVGGMDISQNGEQKYWVDYNTYWQTYTATFTVPDDLNNCTGANGHNSDWHNKGGAWVDMIVFTLNNKWKYNESDAQDYVSNAYCFDNIQLEAWPFEARYTPSGLRSQANYRLLSDGQWTGINKYMQDKTGWDGWDWNNDALWFVKNLEWSQTFTNDGSYNNAHLLIRDDRDASGVYRLPLADISGVRNEAFGQDDHRSVHSTGIRLQISANRRYGFYLHFYDNRNHDREKYIYSEVKGNQEFLNREFGTDYSLDDQLQRDYITYCAMFEQDVSRASSRATEKYTYLTFEDWTTNPQFNGENKVAHHDKAGDYDLNDLAFMVRGINLDDEIITTETETFEFMLCAEDLGVTDDFDFNDMIVGVKAVTKVTGSGESAVTTKDITFRALAAGGTLPLYLHCKYRPAGGSAVIDEVLKPQGVSDAEWHNWFGVSDYRQMINTFNERSYYGGAYCTITTDASFNLSDFGRVGSDGTIGGIYITVNGENLQSGQDVTNPTRVVTSPKPGEAPQMFLIKDQGNDGKGWKWPSERSHIDDVYPRFMDWAAAGAPSGEPDASSVYYWYKDAPHTKGESTWYTNRR